jgi:hypothetical protein
MVDKNVNAIIHIRKNKLVPTSVSDAQIETLIQMGDKIRQNMKPDVEVDYDETQRMAITCSIACDIENDTELDDFDFEKFDKNFESEFFEESEA